MQFARHRIQDLSDPKYAATLQKLAEIEKLEADARDWELADASVAATTLGAEASAARESRRRMDMRRDGTKKYEEWQSSHAVLQLALAEGWGCCGCEYHGNNLYFGYQEGYFGFTAGRS